MTERVRYKWGIIGRTISTFQSATRRWDGVIVAGRPVFAINTRVLNGRKCAPSCPQTRRISDGCAVGEGTVQMQRKRDA